MHVDAFDLHDQLSRLRRLFLMLVIDDGEKQKSIIDEGSTAIDIDHAKNGYDGKLMVSIAGKGEFASATFEIFIRQDGSVFVYFIYVTDCAAINYEKVVASSIAHALEISAKFIELKCGYFAIHEQMQLLSMTDSFIQA